MRYKKIIECQSVYLPETQQERAGFELRIKKSDSPSLEFAIGKRIDCGHFFQLAMEGYTLKVLPLDEDLQRTLISTGRPKTETV